VECALLAVAAAIDRQSLADRLRAAMEEGLLVAEPGAHESVRFRHDRVQQAMLGAMGHERLAQLQLAVARRLAREPTADVEAAQLYLACVNQLTDCDERPRAARLFYKLACDLAAGANHALAERYLAAAGALLATIGDPADAQLRGEIEVRHHAALYSLGRLQESDVLYASIEARITDPMELVEPVCLQMRGLDMRGRMEDSVHLGMRLLTRLGVEVPPDYVAPDTDRQLDSLVAWVDKDSLVEHSARPQLRDARLLAVARLLGRAVRSAVRGELQAAAWLLLQCWHLWAEHGPCPEVVACMGHMSDVLIGRRQNFRGAYAVARHAVTVGKALGYEPQTSQARFLFAVCAGHWLEPMESMMGHAARAHEAVRAGGDMADASSFHRIQITILLECAPHLDAVEAEAQAGIAFGKKAGNHYIAALNTTEKQLVRSLRGEPAGSFGDAQFDERQFHERFGHTPLLHVYETRRALCALLMGERRALARHAARTISRLGVAGGYYRFVHAHLLVAISCAWQLQDTSGASDRQALTSDLKTCRDWLAGRAADQPYNYLHLLHLVEAEEAWAVGDRWRAATAFDAALREAATRQRPWHRALIAERAGLFHATQGLEHTGRQLLTEARDMYAAWGATAKVARMEAEHALLRGLPAMQDGAVRLAPLGSVRGSNGSISPDSLDLVGVLRASQALSSETSLERLAARVTEVLAALSGATRVQVLLWSEDSWRLLAPVAGESPISVAAEGRFLPMSAIAYARRTREVLVVDDAVTDHRFARDPYFDGVPVCSLLAAPISGQGGGQAMLLLESRHGRAAFNARRLDAVMLIAGQLAVSLENAKLYESLERRVQERTRELQETQARLVAAARSAGRAEIANNVLHNVGNVRNSINVSVSVVCRALSDSRAEGLARAVQLMKQHEHELGRFMETDPRGKALLGYLDELTDALAQERVQALLDLDRLRRSVDHISYVVVTQQSNAGPSSLLEIAQPEELLEEALRMSGDVISDAGVSIVRQYANAPPSALDKPRLLQILVNLIGNAAQAMEAIPEQSRRLTLSTAIIRDEEGEWLHIMVRDEGEGISVDNPKRLFAHGFTTRKSGHGFGLHSSALAALEMRGRLTAHSDGPGRGATFTVELPFTQERR
jgi:signal transduction histidine kinase